MESIERVLRKKDLKVGDRAVIYVTTCSDADASLKNARRLLECCVMDIVQSNDKSKMDDRYLIRCPEKLREKKTKDGILLNEALVSVYSPLLLTWEDYEYYMADPVKLSEWITRTVHVITGCASPKYLINWQNDLLEILDKLDIDVDTVVNDIMDDFNPKCRLELIKFQE